MIQEIAYRVGESTAPEIVAHLQECDGAFLEQLRGRTSIEDYAAKLVASAIRLEARGDGRLVGLVAMYLDADTAVAFVTNVSVVPERRGAGIAQVLVATAIERARVAGMARIDLEVDADNAVARILYSGLGFTDGRSTGDTMLLSRYIQTGDQL